MHELSIANAILKMVREERRRRAGARVVAVGVRVGELSGVNPDALRFSFEALTTGTELAPLTLEIELCPRRERCETCGETFAPEDFVFVCPACGGQSTENVSGTELAVTFLEIEAPETAAALRAAGERV